MNGPAHFRAGQRWLEQAEQAHHQMEQRPLAAREVTAATEIATAHFMAAQVALGVHQTGHLDFNVLQGWRSATKEGEWG